MNEILRKVKLKLTDSDDAIAARIAWSPISTANANFKTHELCRESGRIYTKKKNGMKILCGLPIAIGFFVACWGIKTLPTRGVADAMFNGFFGLAFILGGLYIFRSQKDVVIDFDSGCYFFGKNYDKSRNLPRSQQGLIVDVHALQLVKKTISGDGKSRAFSNFELNFVFKNAERTNIMASHTIDDSEEAALIIGDALRVPVWKGV